jgi:hypothetical protein
MTLRPKKLYFLFRTDNVLVELPTLKKLEKYVQTLGIEKIVTMFRGCKIKFVQETITKVKVE